MKISICGFGEAWNIQNLEVGYAFSLTCFWIFLEMFSLKWSFYNLLFSFQVYENISVIYLLSISSWIWLWPDNLMNDFKSVAFIEVSFTIYLYYVYYTLFSENNVLYIVYCTWFTVLYIVYWKQFSISLAILWFLVLLIDVFNKH